MNSYLIVKTGKSGATLSSLYNTKITADGRDIYLCRTRLTGTWYQSIVAAAKKAGIKGTLSVLPFSPEDADVLLKDSQRTFIALAKGLNWKAVARIDATEDDLSKASSDGRQQAWKALEEDGTIVVTKRKRNGGFTYNYAQCQTEEYKAMSYYQRRDVYNAAKKAVRDRVNAGGAEGVKALIKVL